MKRIIAFIIVILPLLSNAQFYNGLQMSFGKNRIQYRPFTWLHLDYPQYQIFFYKGEENLGRYTAKYMPSAISDAQSFFGVYLHDPIIVVVYQNLTDFRQSNVGLSTGNADFNVGGKVQLFNNKIFVYFDNNHKDFNIQIRRLLGNLYLNEIFYGTGFTQRVTNSTLINLPDWYYKGLISYFSNPYDIQVINKTKDLLQNKKHFNFNHLTPKQAEFVGHSFWYFMADVYGEGVISNIIYFTHIQKKINNAVTYVLGKSLVQLTEEWEQYYLEKFQNDNMPDEDRLFKVKRKKIVYQQFRMSPDGKKVAYVQNDRGKYKLYVVDLKAGKRNLIYKQGEKLDQIIDYSYPVVQWNNNGKILAFSVEEKGETYLCRYLLEKKELRKHLLGRIDKIQAISFSQNNQFIVFSGLSDGYMDIFLMDLYSGVVKNLTKDLPDDLDPVFANDDKTIVFSSNRLHDTLVNVHRYIQNPKFGDDFDLFAIDNFLSSKPKIYRLTQTPLENEKQPFPVGKDDYIYLSDRTGIINRFKLSYDSIISFVDTVVHYSYFSSSGLLTNYGRNILQHDYKSSRIAQILFVDQRYKIFLENIETDTIPLPQPDYFKQKYDELERQKIKQRQQIMHRMALESRKIDSLKDFYRKKINSPDTQKVDILHYVFEIEKDTLFGKFYKEYLTQNKKKKDSTAFPPMLFYRRTFYVKDFMSQVDFSMLNQTYQPFTGGAFQFNNGMTYFTTVKLDELFDDYRLFGGFRFSLSGNKEYIFSIENLRKRLDKQIIYHRQVLAYEDMTFYPPTEIRTRSNEMIFVLRYPFSQINSIKFSTVFKYDRKIYLSTEYPTLVAPDTLSLFSGLKLEYIFDNTRELDLNLLDGIRFKVFAEGYQQLNDKYFYTTVFGGDFRFYKNIFRNFIFAARVAGATSLGSGKVVFYLGGVDNWVNLSLSPTSTYYFDRNVNINYNMNYLFQAAATNMRGFPQNIRNGNTFVVSNLELRMPVFQMFFPYPINSDFWRHFQVVGFFDIGSAWAGKSPYDKLNIYNQIITRRPPFTVIVDIDRPPFVFGYGWGLRTKFLGYFVRLDWAWGVEAGYHYPQKFYLSLSKDF